MPVRSHCEARAAFEPAGAVRHFRVEDDERVLHEVRGNPSGGIYFPAWQSAWRYVVSELVVRIYVTSIIRLLEVWQSLDF